VTSQLRNKLIDVSYYVSSAASVRQLFRRAITAIFYCCSVDYISSVKWKDNKTTKLFVTVQSCQSKNNQNKWFDVTFNKNRKLKWFNLFAFINITMEWEVTWGLSSLWKLVLMKYKLVPKRLYSPTKNKKGVTLFAAVYGAPACWIQPNDDLSFTSRRANTFITFVCNISRSLKWSS